MNRATLDKAVPSVYAGLIVIAAIFFPVAVAPIAIFGALVLAGWYSFLRPALRERERAEANRRQDGGQLGSS